MSAEPLTSLENWAKKRYGDDAPSIYTLRRWVKQAKIVPAPKKVGRMYFIQPGAIYLGNMDEIDSARGMFRRMLRDLPLTYPLDYLRGLCGTGHDGPTVYFLWNGPRLLYVGKTIHPRKRLATHTLNRDGRSFYGKPIPFNRFTVLTGATAVIGDIERRHIQRYRPPHNEKFA